MRTTGHSPAPREKELEDLAAALMSCLGYYVSSSLVARPYGASELLEADVVAVKVGLAGTGGTQRVLVEAKSGVGWGNNDLFKLLGQRVFLGIEHALFLTTHGDPARSAEADATFAPHSLRSFHLASGLEDAARWKLWAELADAGIASSSLPPEPEILRAAFESARRRRLAHASLIRDAREPGHSASLEACARIVRTLDDIRLHLAEPQARARALWTTRRDWSSLRLDAAEEAAHGPGHAGRTPEGALVFQRASNTRGEHSRVQAHMLLATRVQLELVLAIVEVAVAGGPDETRPFPVRLGRTVRRLTQLGVTPQFASVVQQIMWHWGGHLRRWELDAVAAESGLRPEDLFLQLSTLTELFKPDWRTSMPPLRALRRKNKKRQLDAASAPVFDAQWVPGMLRSCRRRVPTPTDDELFAMVQRDAEASDA
jgi:hypothetical protein